ncbi:MAG: hypothetical protein FWG68_05965 [Defluviitaleaceae bacterium]|nr:hypothetical protein [Defluviitaleaceae bacterium]
MMDSNVQGILYERFNKRVKSAMSKRKARKRAKKHGIKMGIEIGRKIGKEKKARETAFEMLKRNFDTKDIAAILKMPLEWVQNLKDNTTINPNENTLEA